MPMKGEPIMKKTMMSLALLLVFTVLSGCCPCWWYDGGYGHHGGRHYDDRGGYGERRY